MARLDSKAFIGSTSKASTGPSDGSDPLELATRCHGNYTENVPLALLLGAIVEMNGGNRRVLTGGFAALLLARMLHVELGIRGKGGMGPGRAPGHFMTLGFITGMGG
ncbi:uncharacterized protein HMPREF1541_09324 [Cyphellophora europaea CBS 101466]|uniref:Uncharacterized protein n=1 Tax=Cyphellophora europaea (strain CBS 101466) TaxID=1220924 RepID=W2S9Y2_CYPE1|nr:uncharacterized protein HMPREF1541_09324 [Cyphellophora europaea CBS 101466]ETN45492.1 hypothetical protein HMPREF1541_09324 [Cyphellophora europaea CBS 101466]